MARTILQQLLVGALLVAGATSAEADKTYTTTADFDTGALTSVNDTVVPDQLQLNASSSTEPFIYVANWIDGTVLKINTDTGKQVARYDSALYKNWDGTPNNIRPVREYGSFSCPGGQAPSRTAVDGNGDAFVSNRAFCWYPSVTKYAGSIANCVDRNGNGVIDTSSDVNNDGLVNINDPAEFKGQSDECVLFTKNTLSYEDFGRSLTIDSNGNFWAGGFNTGRMELRSGADGHLMKVINTGIVGMYGLAAGPNGFLYNSDINSGRIAKIDPSKPSGQEIVAQRYVGYGTYGIAVDKNSVVWLGDWTGPGGVVRVDFANNTSGVFGACAGGYCGYSRGVAVDGNGNVWVSVFYGNHIIKFNSAGVVLATYGVDAGPIGVGVDGRGNIWTANQSGRSVTRVNPSNGSTQTFTTNPGYYDSQSYSYSDMTGFQQRNFTAPQGNWDVVYDGGSASTQWGTITINQEAQGSIPAGTQILLQTRAADTVGGLSAVPFTTQTSGVEFLGVTGRYIEVKATLRINSGTTSPILSDLTIKPRNSPPTALCAGSTVCAPNGTCQASVDINNGSSDPEGEPLTFSQNPSVFGIGTTTATLTVSDPNGASTCSAAVTVNDCQPPTVSCGDTTAECTGNASASVTPSVASATDLCTGASITSGPPSGSYPLGNTTVTYVGKDGAGNAAVCAAQIHVVDTTPPTIACPATSVTECTGNASANVTPGVATASDICTAVSVTGPSAGSYPLGSTTVVYGATDQSGNQTACVSQIVVQDTTPPSITCPAPVTVECVNNGASVTPAHASAVEVCTSATVSNPSANFFPLGTTVTSYSAVDQNGNSSSCTSSITVKDTTPPVVTVGDGTGSAQGSLWPPNHSLRTFDVGGDCNIAISDACQGKIAVNGAQLAITCVSSDEGVLDNGSGNTQPDIVIVDATHVQLRAERNGGGDGRVYKIGFSVTDAHGNVATGACRIDTSNSQNGTPAVDSGAKYQVCR